jgi:DNA topoisomerase-6 subunit A
MAAKKKTPAKSPAKAAAKAAPAKAAPAKAAPVKPAPVAAKKPAKAAKPAPAKAEEKRRLNATQLKTTGKLVKLAENVAVQIEKRKHPQIAIPTRSLANTYYDEKRRIVQIGDEKTNRQFFNIAMAKKFMQTFLVAGACKELVESGKTTSIRDLYYMTKHTLGETKGNTFEEQEESDPIIEDLEVTVNSLREELHLFASNKGSMAGELTLVDAGDTIDLRAVGSGGWSVPSIVESDVVQFKKCDAQYVLLVEKDAVWRRFNEDKYWRKNKCIIVHGGGQPPRGVRRLLRRMNEELKLPVYVLVDNDPWGFYIYSVVKQGSINLAFESMRMAVPNARFVGLSSFDRDRFALPNNVTIKLDETDINRTKQMLSYKWFDKPQWRRELDHMIKSGVKLELEALSSKGISFITEEYMPRKLKEKDWLE